MIHRERAIEWAQDTVNQSVCHGIERTLARALLPEVERVKELEDQIVKNCADEENEFEAWRKKVNYAACEIKELEAKLAKTVEALEFYSKEENLIGKILSNNGWLSSVSIDRGSIARACLEELRAE